MRIASLAALESSCSPLQNSREFGKPLFIAAESVQREFGHECDYNSVRHTKSAGEPDFDADHHPYERTRMIGLIAKAY